MLDPMATHVSNFGAGKIMLEDARELAAWNEILEWPKDLL
jgi:hypothetical protein